MTAAVESLHRLYPGEYLTDVQVPVPELFDHNPHITKLDREDPDIRVVHMEYPLIDRADHQPANFMQGFCECLGKALEIDLPCVVKKPSVYLTDEEKSWTNQVEQHHGYGGKFWLVNAGFKNDYTVKKWTTENWQRVVDTLLGEVQFVQVGSLDHNHPPLRNIIDLRGQTDHRQLIRLCYHAQGAITPESYLHHLMAAFAKPCVTLASGFLPTTWIKYHTGTVLSRQEAMPCCRGGVGCWKARVVPIGDGDTKERNLCSLPVLGDDAVAWCMAMISPDEVVAAVRAYFEGGLLSP